MKALSIIKEVSHTTNRQSRLAELERQQVMDKPKGAFDYGAVSRFDIVDAKGRMFGPVE